MLGNQQRRAGCRQRLQHMANRFGAAGGGADSDQLLAAQQRSGLQHRWRGLRAARHQTGAGGGADLVGDHLAVGHHAFTDAQLRFGDEIDRPQLQRAQCDFRAFRRQRRDHHDRHRTQTHQFFQEIEAVHARHLDVQRQHLRVVLFNQIARHQRIGGRGHHFHIGMAVDDLRHQLTHQR